MSKSKAAPRHATKVTPCRPTSQPSLPPAPEGVAPGYARMLRGKAAHIAAEATFHGDPIWAEYTLDCAREIVRTVIIGNNK